jgi:Na+-transporting NADH:ubiquinone oxidoreductase subunit NqrD
MEIIKKRGNYNVEVIFFRMPVHFVMVEFVLWLIRLFNVRQICEID